jgi:hypothetical protein
MLTQLIKLQDILIQRCREIPLNKRRLVSRRGENARMSFKLKQLIASTYWKQ